MAMKAEPELLIGELAERVGLDPKTIRYYEQVGLLEAPARSESGYRLYQDSDAERLRFIRGVRRLGFSLGEIREILVLRDQGAAPCGYVAERLDLRAREVDHEIRELRRLKTELRRLRLRARRLGTDMPSPGCYCHILESKANAEQ
jgi:DNA-binding transcriptional MerR regulator